MILHSLLFLSLTILHSTLVQCIIQGSPCQNSESFNHVVLIFSKSRLKHCTGTLISSSWIVTSASCFAFNGTVKVRPESLLVQAGSLQDYVSHRTINRNEIQNNIKSRKKRFTDFIDASVYDKISKTLQKSGHSAASVRNPTIIVKKNRELNLEHVKETTRDMVTKAVTTQATSTKVMMTETSVNGMVTNSTTVSHGTTEPDKMFQYVRAVVEVHLCPNYDLDAKSIDRCDLALIKVDHPYVRSRSISWLPIGNGPPPESPFKAHLCGWGGRRREELMEKKGRNLVKNFVRNIQILPPAQCPPSRKEAARTFCLMSVSRGHPSWGDEGLPLVVNSGPNRRLVGVGSGSKPILVYKRRRDCGPLKERWRLNNNRKSGKKETRRNKNESVVQRRKRRNSQFFSCGHPGRYYVFTNLCYNMDWIYQVIPTLTKTRNICDYVTNSQ